MFTQSFSALDVELLLLLIQSALLWISPFFTAIPPPPTNFSLNCRALLIYTTTFPFVACGMRLRGEDAVLLREVITDITTKAALVEHSESVGPHP